MTFGEYLVTGHREYRGHTPGTVFEARLDTNAEARAIQRGNIRLLRRIKRGLNRENITFPDGWLPSVSPQANQEAAEAASLVTEGG